MGLEKSNIIDMPVRVEVFAAYLQTPTTVPGMFSTATALNSTSQPGIKMYHHPHGGLEIKHNGFIAFIPYTNVKMALLSGK